MYTLYYEDQQILDSTNKHMIWHAFTNHVRNKLKVNPGYYRIVRLNDYRVMIDFGSHSKFYYVTNTLLDEKFEESSVQFKL
jgi:hypothetical protein